MTAFEQAQAGIKEVFEAIPKGKFRTVFLSAQNLELGMNRMASALNQLRDYFLDTTGEDSPFVKKIDELVPRKK